MNAFIHDMEADIALGATMNRPAFLSNGSLRKFAVVTANPMWNQDFPQSTFENDTYSRFLFGYPPSSSADWGWIQHMFASLGEEGRMAVGGNINAAVLIDYGQNETALWEYLTLFISDH